MEMQRLRRSNFYSESPLDRADYRRQDEAWLAGRLKAEGTRFVALWQNRNLVDRLEGDPPRNARGPRQAQRRQRRFAKCARCRNDAGSSTIGKG